MHPSPALWAAIPLLALLLIWRLRRASREQALKIDRMWVTPALLLAIGALTIAQTPLRGLGWLWLIPGFAVGAAVGFWRGRLTTVAVDPQTHDLTSRTSPAGLYLLIAILALRLGLRALFAAEARRWHVDVAVVTDVFLVFAVGLVAVQRLEIWVRARRLLSQARAAGPPDAA